MKELREGKEDESSVLKALREKKEWRKKVKKQFGKKFLRLF